MDHVLSARNLLIHLSLTQDIDAPVIIRHGLWGHEYSVVRAISTLTPPDLHIDFKRPLPELVVTHDVFDKPGHDQGWGARALGLRALLEKIGEQPDA